MTNEMTTELCLLERVAHPLRIGADWDYYHAIDRNAKVYMHEHAQWAMTCNMLRKGVTQMLSVLSGTVVIQ